jgi:hypothetical protein
LAKAGTVRPMSKRLAIAYRFMRGTPFIIPSYCPPTI